MTTIYGSVPASFETIKPVRIDANKTDSVQQDNVDGRSGPVTGSGNPASQDSSPECYSEHPGYTTGYQGHINWTAQELRLYAEQHGTARTILRAYREYGTDLMKVIGGSYVLVVVDREKKLCILATDRFGTHPLYYTHCKNNYFSFSSSLRTLVEQTGRKYTINPQAIFDYTYLHVIPSPDTIYKDIYKLEPAQQLIFSDGNIHKSYHWMPSFNKSHPATIEPLKKELLVKLNNAVTRLVPDNKTGCFLSGGLDSSTVTGLLANIQKGSTNAFSIGFSEEGFDEMPYARISARHFGAELHEYYITPEDIVESIPVIAGAYDEPFGNSSAVPVLFCARLARKSGMDTLLAGDGGDELFGGNERYAKQKIFDLYHRVPRVLRKTILEPLFVSLPCSRWTAFGRKLRSYIEQARLEMPTRLESYNFLKRTPLDTIFDRSFLDSVDTTYPDHQCSKVYNRIDSATLLDRMLYHDWKLTLADNDLPKVSRMCEVAGIQVRYPMLDDEVVDFSTKVPSEMALKGQKLRYFYKQALADFLPAEVITKSKHGFGLPFGQWLRKSDELKQLVYSNLQSIKQRKIFREEFIDQLIELHDAGHASYHGTMVWVIVILEEWFKQHGNPEIQFTPGQPYKYTA